MAQIDLEKLKDPTVVDTFQATTGGKFEPLLMLGDENTDLDSMVANFNSAVTDSTKEVLGKPQHRKKPWVTAAPLDFCDERRDLKRQKNLPEGAEKYMEINRRINKEMKHAKESWTESDMPKQEQPRKLISR